MRQRIIVIDEKPRVIVSRVIYGIEHRGVFERSASPEFVSVKVKNAYNKKHIRELKDFCKEFRPELFDRLFNNRPTKRVIVKVS